MDVERLTIYLNDHLAVLVGESELAKRCHSNNPEGPLAIFLARLISDLADQQKAIQHVLEKIGGSESYAKQGMGWIAEKLGRFKLNDSLLRYSELSRMVELESLAVGALNRQAFWDTLHIVGVDDPRLETISFPLYRDQSQKHLEELTTHRQLAARQAF